MIKITQAELDRILNNAARRDMGIARRSGALCITETKQGNIELTYDQTTKLYYAHNFNFGNRLFEGVNAAAARKFLVEQVYDVQLQGTEVVG